MTIKTKIKAFTIAELLVVLVITGIVISIALVVLNLVQKQVFGIQNLMKKNQEVQIFERVLWQDFHTYKLECFSKEDLLVCMNPTDTVTYRFSDNYILRNTDTIPVKINEKVFYLDAIKVKQSSIDAVEIILSEKFQNKTLFIYQNKDAFFYMNQ